MSTKNPFDPAALSDNVKEQAQQIWLAGLGAFEKLVSDGITMQRKVHTTAEEKLAEATQKATQAAHTLSERATGQWGKLENIFEDRVAKALHSLGLPSAAEMEALHARVAALEAQLGGKARPAAKSKPQPTSKAHPAAKAAAKSASKPTVKTAAKKAPAKKTAKR
jgi:poly(hydroxyalkanoate) granule-associated protein